MTFAINSLFYIKSLLRPAEVAADSCRNLLHLCLSDLIVDCEPVLLIVFIVVFNLDAVVKQVGFKFGVVEIWCCWSPMHGIHMCRLRVTHDALNFGEF